MSEMTEEQWGRFVLIATLITVNVWAVILNTTLAEKLDHVFDRVESAYEVSDLRARCCDLRDSIRAFERVNQKLEKQIRFFDERFPEAKNLRRDIDEFVEEKF